MIGEKLAFDAALPTFALYIVGKLGEKALEDGRFVRDVFGRLTFITDRNVSPELIRQAVDALPGDLQPFLSRANPAKSILRTPKDKENFLSGLLTQHGLLVRFEHEGRDIRLRLIDQRLAGEDWLSALAPDTAPDDDSSSLFSRRFAFYSIKGGVGRSTALCVAAAELARRGRRVLAVDLDLEAPGLGSLLLAEDRVPDYGVIDWFVAAGLGIHDDMLLADMVGESRFTTGSGFVDVAPAAGRRTLDNAADYLGKLARAYAPGAAVGEFAGQSFTRKVAGLLSRLEKEKKYDVVLIDVRAGLHETSAASVLGLGAEVLLFATDSTQTFDDYRLLFGHLARLVEGAAAEGGFCERAESGFRERLKMAQGKAPDPMAGESDRFLEESWKLWLDTLYDADSDAPDSFSFDLHIKDAPHYPLRVIETRAYAKADFRRRPELLDENAYTPYFHDLIGYIAGAIP